MTTVQFNRVMARTGGLQGVQDRYSEAVNSALARWGHCRKLYPGDRGGHANRIVGAAYRRALKDLAALGFDREQSRIVLKDAEDMAALQRHADASPEVSA